MNQEPRTETVGKISEDLLNKRDGGFIDPIAHQREIQKSYIKDLTVCVNDGKKKYDGDFYVVCLTRAERMMPNVFRNVFLHRHTCPTSEHDQSVFMYIKEIYDIKYLWTVPCKDACIYLKRNKHLVEKEEQESLKFVLAFDDGTLDRLAMKMNKEKEEMENVSTIIRTNEA